LTWRRRLIVATHELEEREGLLSSSAFADDMGREGEDGGEVVVDVLREAPDAVLNGAVDPVYEAKARVLNKAIQDIGMGRYQWQVRARVFW
jgi:hypothetical protein